MTKPLRDLALGLVLPILTACVQQPTQIIVDVDAEGGMDDAAVRVEGVERARAALPIDGAPLSLTLVHGGGGYGPIFVEALAYSAAGAVVARDCERVSFLPRTTVRVRLELVAGTLGSCPNAMEDGGVPVEDGGASASPDAGASCDPVTCAALDPAATCTEGVCVLPACPDDRADCVEDVAGCETDIRKSSLHCGGCDQPCDGDEVCMEGACIED